MADENKEERARQAYQLAREIIDKDWLAAGATREELDQEEQLADLLNKLVASGRAFEDIMEEWEHKSPAEILHEYAKPASALRSA